MLKSNQIKSKNANPVSYPSETFIQILILLDENLVFNTSSDKVNVK